MIFRIVLFVIAALLLAAHFMREGNYIFMMLCLAVPLFFLFKKRWVLIFLQLAAYVGGLTWIMITVDFVRERMYLGEPWRRLVMILGPVAVVTIVSGLLLNSRVMKERYPA